MTGEAALGYVLADDLMFVSRITGTARDLGFTMRSFRTAAALLEKAREQAPVCVLVDLHLQDLDIAALVAELKKASLAKVIAFGSHVAVEVLDQARQAGCDVVWPRGKFVDQLPLALPEWMKAAR